jgi:RimJ/RimL family protein N-acetyltransferase
MLCERKSSMTNLFHGVHVRLAAPTPDDIPIVSDWSNDAEFLRRLQFGPARPLNQSEAADSYLGGGHGHNHTHFRLRTLADDRLVGYVVLYDIYWNLQTANVGIAIGNPADRGKGYGRDGMQLILRYAFNELNLHRVGLTVLERNHAARKVYESIGFVIEGILRDTDYRDGIRGNDIQMSILAHEWRARNPQ